MLEPQTSKYFSDRGKPGNKEETRPAKKCLTRDVIAMQGTRLDLFSTLDHDSISAYDVTSITTFQQTGSSPTKHL